MRYVSFADDAKVIPHVSHRMTSAHGAPCGGVLHLSGRGRLASFHVTGRVAGVVLGKCPGARAVQLICGNWSSIVALDGRLLAPIVTEVPLGGGGGDVLLSSVDLPGDRETQEVLVLAVYEADDVLEDVPAHIRASVHEAPFEAAQLNQLTDVFKWYDEGWQSVMRAFKATPDYAPPDFVHRKAWEWVQCLYGLDWLGMLDESHAALGVGVGFEPLSYFLSNVLGDVVATDLYPQSHMWSESGAREGNPEILADPEKFAPYDYRKDRLTFRRMDGSQLDFPSERFDIVWTCSSIEHFGGHAAAARSMQEIQRVLRPGGVAVVITEYVLPEPMSGRLSFDSEYFNQRCLYEFLIRPVRALRLVQPLDLTVPDYYIRRAVHLPEEAQAPHAGSTKPHIVLRTEREVLLTSVALFFRKSGGSHRRGRHLFVRGRP
jgi:SAM-dependent methyltransferase